MLRRSRFYRRFEIRSSDNSYVFVGCTPDECHRKLLMAINERNVRKLVDDRVSQGADFFGLTNPTVHYLITSCEGASKCIKYDFKKFAVRKVSVLFLRVYILFCAREVGTSALLLRY